MCACTGAEKDADIALASADGEQYGEGEIWVCPSLFGAEAGNDVLRMLIDGLPAQVVFESRVQGSSKGIISVGLMGSGPRHFDIWLGTGGRKPRAGS